MPAVNVSMGTLTLWQSEDLLSFLANESVIEMVIGSRFQVDWSSAVSIAKVSVTHVCLCRRMRMYVFDVRWS